MGRLDSSQPLLFWRTLVIRILRLAVQVALRSQRMSAADLKALLEVAMFRELRSRGYSLHAMSLALDCSPRAVKNYSERSRTLHQLQSGDGTLGRLVRALKDGPRSFDELDECAVNNDEFNVTRVALRILMSRGLVELCDARAQTYQLSPRYRQLEAAEWSKPLSELESQYAVGLMVLQILAEGAISRSQLLAEPRLKLVSEAEIRDALAFLMGVGYVSSYRAGEPAVECYRIEKEEIPLIPRNPAERQRVGLLDLTEKLSLFLDSTLDDENDAYLGQRSWMFSARPEDLRVFIREHRQMVRDRVLELEGPPDQRSDQRPCVMFWAIAPLSRREQL